MNETKRIARAPAPANHYEVFMWLAMALQFTALSMLVWCICSWADFRFFAASVVAWFGCFLLSWHAREVWVESGFREMSGPPPDPDEDLFPNR